MVSRDRTKHEIRKVKQTREGSELLELVDVIVGKERANLVIETSLNQLTPKEKEEGVTYYRT